MHVKMAMEQMAPKVNVFLHQQLITIQPIAELQNCTNVKGVCSETDVSTLNADKCYTTSGYIYTWS